LAFVGRQASDRCQRLARLTLAFGRR